MNAKCLFCNKEFKKTTATRKFCSPSCGNKYRYALKRNGSIGEHISRKKAIRLSIKTLNRAEQERKQERKEDAKYMRTLFKTKDSFVTKYFHLFKRQIKNISDKLLAIKQKHGPVIQKKWNIIRNRCYMTYVWCKNKTLRRSISLRNIVAIDSFSFYRFFKSFGFTALEKTKCELCRTNLHNNNRVIDNIKKNINFDISNVQIICKSCSEKKSKTLGLKAGLFTIVHNGHVDMLKESARRCDRLIVLVGCNEKVLAKKNCVPLDVIERMEIIKSIKWVDEVHCFSEETEENWAQHFIDNEISNYNTERLVVFHDPEVRENPPCKSMEGIDELFFIERKKKISVSDIFQTISGANNESKIGI